MNTEEAFNFLSLKDKELRKLYLDLLEENVKLKKEVKNLEAINNRLMKIFKDTLKELRIK